MEEDEWEGRPVEGARRVGMGGELKAQSGLEHKRGERRVLFMERKHILLPSGLEPK